MLQLVKTMNDASGASKVEEERLDKWFSRSWEEFDKQVASALSAKTIGSAPTKAGPTERELLEEVLATVRRQAIEPRMKAEEWMRGMEGPLVVPPEILLRRFSNVHPRVQELLIELLDQDRGDPERWNELALMVRRGKHFFRSARIEGTVIPPQPEGQKSQKQPPTEEAK